MISAFVLLFVSLLGLWFAGELVVRYSLQLAYKAGLSTLFIGFFLISLSTGLPELSVVINALWLGIPRLSVGDIMGSNFFDLAMGLGIPAFFIRPISITKTKYTKTLFMLISTFTLMLFILTRSSLNAWHGAVLIGTYLFINLLSYRVRIEEDNDAHHMASAQRSLEQEPYLTSTFGTAIKLFIAIVMVLITSHSTVHQAIALAHALGYSIAHFGATFLAIGTSLPELTLGIAALKNREYDLVLGNCFGSIWGQGGLLMGLLALLSAEPIQLDAIASIKPFVIVAYGITTFFIVQRKKITRLGGLLLIICYLLFLLFELT